MIHFSPLKLCLIFILIEIEKQKRISLIHMNIRTFKNIKLNPQMAKKGT